MHSYAHHHHWLVEWLYLGLICAVVVLVNILARTVTEDTTIMVLSFGAIAWLVGGIVFYGVEHLHSIEASQSEPSEQTMRRSELQPVVWHCASDFLIPGASHSFVARYCRKLRH